MSVNNRLERLINERILEKEFWGNIINNDVESFQFNINSRTKQNQKLRLIKNSIINDKLIVEELERLCNNSDFSYYVFFVSILNIILYKTNFDSKASINILTPLINPLEEQNSINSCLLISKTLNQETSFKHLLSELIENVKEVLKHQNFPLDYYLNKFSDNNDNRFSNIGFVYENLQENNFGKLEPEFLFKVRKGNSTIDLEISYSSGIEDSFVELIFQQFSFVIKQVILDKSVLIKHIDVLPEEQKNILTLFNNTELNVNNDQLLNQLFEKQADKTPNQAAIIIDDKKITYKDLNCKANYLAKVLKDKGIKERSFVGVVAEPDHHTILAILAILKLGATYVPLDKNFSESRINYIINDCEIEILLLSNDLVFNTDIFNVSYFKIDYDKYSFEANNIDSQIKPNDLAYVIYTSGSTGSPKGVMIEHRSVVNQILGLNNKFFNRTRLNQILLAALTFDLSVQHIFSPLSYGGTVHLLSNEHDDPQYISRYIAENNINIIDGVPALIESILSFVDENKKLNLDILISGGDVFPISLYEEIKKKCNVDKVVNIYGPTEASINSTYYEVHKIPENKNIPIGKPLHNYQIEILNDRNEKMPVGVFGEIGISGIGLARGYIKDIEKTELNFIDYSKDKRIYKTGDIGRWLNNGSIEFINRVDHQVKIRGYRIELGEIEKIIIGLPEIKEAVVKLFGETSEEKKIVGYYTCKKAIKEEDLKANLHNILPDYMVPGRIIMLDEFPKTSNGKIDRNSLPQPDFIRVDKRIAPINETEKKIVELWSEILSIDEKNLSTEDDFFKIGGHSILGIKLINKINSLYGINISLKEIFNYQTIKEISSYVDMLMWSQESYKMEQNPDLQNLDI